MRSPFSSLSWHWSKDLSHQQGRCWGSLLSFLSLCLHIQWYSAYFQQPKWWIKITAAMGQVGDLVKSCIDFISFCRNCIYHLSIYIMFWSNPFPISSIKITAHSYHQFIYKLRQPFLRSRSPFMAKDLSWSLGHLTEGQEAPQTASCSHTIHCQYFLS